MKVSGPSGASPAGAPTGARPAAPAGGFAPILSPAAPETAGVATASGIAQVGSLEALIALQGVGGPLERRRRAAGRAGGILDALEGLKIDLLEGRLSPGSIEALTRAVHEQRVHTEDPRLEGLLDEIETRAAVELAKLEVASHAA
ncbi:MAG: flagellar assembly protein FliX [Caulobacterales bacterium]